MPLPCPRAKTPGGHPAVKRQDMPLTPRVGRKAAERVERGLGSQGVLGVQQWASPRSRAKATTGGGGGRLAEEASERDRLRHGM